MLSGFDERGQAIQIGAVLLFGILIVGLSTYQAFVVPDQNRQIEFNHNQEVQQELQDLRNGIVSIPGGSDGRSVTVPLGVQYPSRVVAVNPGPATGSLRTTGTANGDVNATVLNATAEGETGDFWDGQDQVYTTGGLVYRPSYNEYRQAPRTVYDSTVLFNQFGGRNLSITGQRLVTDERINLVTLNGSLNVARSGATSVDLQAVSSSARTIAVENASAGENVTIAVATRLNESVWRTLLEPELVENGGHVYNVSSEPIAGTQFQQLSIRLESDVEYTLRVTRVGVGTGIKDPNGEYLTTVSGNGSAVPEGSTQKLVVEVRDGLNNPVSGVEVNASANRSSVLPSTDTTDADGRIAFTYEPPSDIDGGPKSVAVNLSTVVDPATRSSFDPETVDNVSFSLTVRNTDGSGTGGSGISGNVVYDGDAVNADGPANDGIPAGINFSIVNNYDQSIVITEIDIDPADSNIARLSDGVSAPNDEIARAEVYVDGDTSDAYVDYSGYFSGLSFNTGVPLPTSTDLDFDGSSNNGNAKTPAGGTATVYLYEFVDSNDDEVNMTDNDVSITVTYRLNNGLLGESTFTVTPSYSGVDGEESGTDPPTIDSFSATGKSNDRITVSTDVSDSGSNLDRVEFRIFDDSGNQVELDTVSVSGGSDSITNREIQNTDANNGKFSSGDYTVELIVFDDNGDSVSQSRTVTIN
jgi:hypothetical protein